MSRKKRLEIVGAEDEGTLQSTTMLAIAYRLEGRWEEAEKLFVQVIETSKTKLGEDHPSTLTSMASLARTFRSSGQDTAAFLLMAECVRLRNRTLGPDHPHTLSSMSTLTEWRGKASSLSSQPTKPPTESKENQIPSSSLETSQRVSRAGGHRRRTIFLRLFSRK